MILVAALGLGVLAAGWVIYPIVFRRWGLLGDAIPAHLLDSETRKRIALAALKDVEYDRAAGKLDDTDYREIRGSLEREALEAIQAVERHAMVAGGVATTSHACGFHNPVGSNFCAGCGKRLP